MTLTNDPSAEPIIRRARIEDYERLCALYEQLDAFHCHARPDIFVKPEGEARSIERVSQQIHGPDSAVFVAERTGAVLGFAVVAQRQVPAIPVRRSEAYADLDELVVDESHRRMGLGRRLIAASEAWARERGLASLSIGVWAFNSAAWALYECAGYKVQTLRLAKRL